MGKIGFIIILGPECANHTLNLVAAADSMKSRTGQCKQLPSLQVDGVTPSLHSLSADRSSISEIQCSTTK